MTAAADTANALPDALGADAREFLARPQQLLIGEERLDAADGATFATLDPSSGREIATVAQGGAEDVARAVAAARAAFEQGKWATMPATGRERLMHALATAIDEHAQELAELESLDNGKPVGLAKMIDVRGAAAHLRYFAGWPSKIEGGVLPVSAPDVLCYTRREPVGVCGQIIPWNFPLLMASWKIGPALAAGNSMIVKPAEQSPLTAIRIAELAAEAVDKVYDEIAPTDPSVVTMIVREPVGVVGAVVPWNFPLMMASWKVGPALAAGNSVVLKPAEQSPLTALRLAELAVEAGLPEGVLQVLPGFGETAGQALGLHMDVDLIAFTGSTEVGKYFLRYSGDSNMKRLALECGGKSPHIVMPDCPDLDAAASAVAWGVFYNQGEVCNAGSRLLVHESLKDELLERVVKVSERIQPGDPLDPKTRMGALVDDKQLDRVLGYIESGREEGANLHLGGNRTRVESGGYFVEPTIFDAVS
ncbi:MAG TPA: aldehyde dehydrogenase family protein, partial [Solirubrobacteraceae bacterium]